VSDAGRAHDGLLAAEELFAAGRLDESKDAFAALLISEVRADALFGLAMISSGNGDLERAQALLEQSLGARRRNPAALYQLARTHLVLGEEQRAIALLGETLADDPSHDAALRELAALARTAGRGAEATDFSAVEQPPRSPRTPDAEGGPAASSEAAGARPPRPPHDPSAIVGVARSVVRGVGPWRGKPAALQIWTFRVQTFDEAGNPGRVVGVDMRGHEIRGTLDNGDWVEIAERPKAGEGCRPKQLRNITTDDVVRSRMRIFNAQ
jgi:hypothetical protein